MSDIDFSWALQEAGRKWKSYTCIQCLLEMWRREARGLGLVLHAAASPGLVSDTWGAEVRVGSKWVLKLPNSPRPRFARME